MSETPREKNTRIAAAARAETQAIHDNRIILPQEKKQKTEAVNMSTLPFELLLAVLGSLALDARDGVEAASYLYEAETALLATNRYIPLGAPIRWSLVRADIEAFAENPWNIHPLFPLSRAPI